MNVDMEVQLLVFLIYHDNMFCDRSLKDSPTGFDSVNFPLGQSGSAEESRALEGCEMHTVALLERLERGGVRGGSSGGGRLEVGLLCLIALSNELDERHAAVLVGGVLCRSGGLASWSTGGGGCWGRRRGRGTRSGSGVHVNLIKRLTNNNLVGERQQSSTISTKNGWKQIIRLHNP
mgnify:CR=1 FL=1